MVKNKIKKYRLFLILLLINLLILLIDPNIGRSSFAITRNNLVEMITIIPPIFILLGLLDVWVPKEIIIKYMGEKSGFKGMLLAFLLGSAAAGPLYAAFLVAGVLIKKGTKLSNIFIFIGAWSTTKIPLLLFEATSMGWKFTILRLVINIFGIVFLAFTTEKVLNKEEKIIYSIKPV